MVTKEASKWLLARGRRSAYLAASFFPERPMIDRIALRLAYRPDENEIVQERLAQAKLSASQQGEASAIARTLVKAVRGHKAAGLDAFLQAYDLG